MRDSGVQKTPGSNWIEVKNHVHEFIFGDEKQQHTAKRQVNVAEPGYKVEENDQVTNSSTQFWVSDNLGSHLVLNLQLAKITLPA